MIIVSLHPIDRNFSRGPKMRSQLGMLYALLLGSSVNRISAINKELSEMNKKFSEPSLQGPTFNENIKIKPGKSVWEAKFRK